MFRVHLIANRYSSGVIFLCCEDGSDESNSLCVCHEGWYWSMMLTYELRDISLAIHWRTRSLPARFSGSARCRMIRPRTAIPTSMTRSFICRCISLTARAWLQHCRVHGKVLGCPEWKKWESHGGCHHLIKKEKDGRICITPQ
jgi:hypothetical protein